MRDRKERVYGCGMAVKSLQSTPLAKSAFATEKNNMAVKMRLRRMGSRNAPFYRVVIQDGRRAPTGRFIETIGWYDPKQEGTNFSINLDRVEYWTSSGAQPSDTVASLIKKARSLPVTGAVSADECHKKL